MFNTGHRGLDGVCRSILGINVLSIRVTMWMGRHLASTSDICGFRIPQHQTLDSLLTGWASHFLPPQASEQHTCSFCLMVLSQAVFGGIEWWGGMQGT